MSTDNLPTASDLLAGGAPTLKYPTPGTLHKGTVVEVTSSQQTDFDTGALKFYDDGNPMMQLVVTLATEERDQTVANDDGERRLFAKGNMVAAIRQALREEKATMLEPGDLLAVKYVGDGTPSKAGRVAPKEFVAQIQKGAGGQIAVLEAAPAPAPAVDAGDLF